MGLDYTAGCVNFRDVGEFLNIIAGRMVLPPRRLLRGGKLDFVRDASSIGSPGTIVNLRKSNDYNSFSADYLHFPISNDFEKYQTDIPEVRFWLNSVVAAFEDSALKYPVLIHCTSGKDRTGIVVAALLRILGVPDTLIVEEYLLSDGEVRQEWITQALNGIGDPAKYFKRIDLELVRRNVLGQI